MILCGPTETTYSDESVSDGRIQAFPHLPDIPLDPDISTLARLQVFPSDESPFRELLVAEKEGCQFVSPGVGDIERFGIGCTRAEARPQQSTSWNDMCIESEHLTGPGAAFPCNHNMYFSFDVQNFPSYE